ncbi:MAG: hypothetical protein EXS03_01880 [Phycisphaerales bacterium]|nr:hypothetical protein [Phycisphaerales bacterium]
MNGLAHHSIAILVVAALTPTVVAQTPSLQPRMGAKLDGLTADQVERFAIGKELFSRPITIEEGLGPIMNKTNCGSCHANPPGGWGAISVTRFGIEKKGTFYLYPGETQSLAQALANSSFCAEVVPPGATVVRTRFTNSSMAFGLVEAIPDAQISANADDADANEDGISGRVHWVTPLETPGGPLRAGRFGWKAQVATVLTFSGDASRNEMGFTNRLSSAENPPNGDFARLVSCDTVADPEDVADAQGFHFIDRVTDFQRFLAPPPQTPKSGMAGEVLFDQIGCTKCHIAQFTTSIDPSLEDAIRGVTIRPYCDFLLHDMGLLADGISDGAATEAEMRTPTLWGVRRRDPMLHNGAAGGGSFPSRVAIAIAAHGPYGEAAASAAAFAALSSDGQSALIAFLNSLGRAEFDLSGDNLVDFVDFLALRQCLAQVVTNPDDGCAVADLNQDSLVNAADVDGFIAAYEGTHNDCNRNGVPDLKDIALGTSTDSNDDGVPDDCLACHADLDGSGFVDALDLTPVLSGWGLPGAGDIDGSGAADALDLAIVLAAWGDCP